MGTFLVYILKSSLCLAAFYLFYRLLLSRETLHRFNRMALLGVLLLSAVVPLIEVSTEQPTGVGQGMLTLEEWLVLSEAMPEVSSTPVEEARAVWPLVLLAVYGVGVLFFLGRNLLSLIRLGQLLRGTRREDIRRYVADAPRILLFVHERGIAPFSWMRYIVIARKDLEEDGRPILLHELAHIRCGHSWDLLLADLCCFVQWFNPAAWLLKQELQAVHEYEADEAVLRSGVNAREYQLLLLKKAVGTRLYSMANSLNHSKLKKRITMMQRRKSNPWARAKLLYVLPLAAVAVAAFARPEVSGVSNELSAAKVTDLAEIMKAESVKSALVPQDTARKVNQFYQVHSGASGETRAGLEALVTYFNKHVSQSVATEEGVPDKMLMRLVFNQGGELAEVKVLEGVDPATDAEAVRVMRNIPRSVSEKLKGDTIAFAFTVPVKFSVAPLKEGMGQSGSVVTIGDKSSLAPQDMAKSSRSQRGATNVPRLEDFRVPEFPGGREAQMRFLADNMRYPQEAREKGIEGKVIVKFSVADDTGEILNPRVIRSVHPALDAEALRLVKAMPRWTWIGDLEKKKLKSVEIEQPIEFRLDGKNTAEVYDMVAEAPQFPGGSKAMREYLKTNMRYPQIAKENGIQGRVILQFVVDETGKVRDPKILRSVDPALDAEAIRLVEAMPLWTPGKQDGKAVAVRFTVPVAFSLQEDGKLPQKSKSVWAIDGKIVPYEQVKAMDSSEIATIHIWKGQDAIDRYGEQVTGDVIEVITKKASDGEEVLSVSGGKMSELYKHTGILGIGNRKTGTSVNPDSVLILIDGVPATEETFRALSPEKIASVSVMKDDMAETLSIKYGKKALNGVMAIRTKDAAAHFFSQKDNVMIAVSPSDKNAEQITVDGIVTDEKGKPILGAIVREASAPEKGVVTDGQGCFKLSAPKGAMLEVVFVGFHTARVLAQPKMTIKLKAE